MVEASQGSGEAPHIPVLLHEVLSVLEPERTMTDRSNDGGGGLYLDGTLGYAGHARAVLDANPANRLIGLDRDPQARAFSAKRLEPYADRVLIRDATYAEFGAVLDEVGLGGPVLDGVLLDLGVSSLQLDEPERGFSFMREGPLDMRMNPTTGQTAAEYLAGASFEELRQVLGEWGEEPQAARIARAIVAAREAGELPATTLQLAELVVEAYPPKWRRTAKRHPATRTFQALRMAVNAELGQLETFLEQVLPRMRPDGRIAVISFHSLEDRLVKQFIREHTVRVKRNKYAAASRVRGGQPQGTLEELTKRPLEATPQEATANPRARSAKLRAARVNG